MKDQMCKRPENEIEARAYWDEWAPTCLSMDELKDINELVWTNLKVSAEMLNIDFEGDI